MVNNIIIKGKNSHSETGEKCETKQNDVVESQAKHKQKLNESRQKR